MKRRTFLQQSAFASVAGALSSRVFSFGGQLRAEDTGVKPCDLPVFVSTWPFGRAANEAALLHYRQNANLLDAVEAGIKVTEADVNNSSVGIGGFPNANGVVQLDACIMNGADHRAGSVTALEGILHPISVAKRVMETTPHVMLTGAGAREFALSEGFETTELLTPARKAAWQKWKQERNSKASNHDTIALLGLGPDGNLAGGCSTSGLAYKLPGRVGDSPIIGGGLYVDNEVGAAGATGVGENIMRYCGTFLVVEFMRQGATPEEACIKTIERIDRLDPKALDQLSVFFIALDKKGRFGAAGSGGGFDFAVTTSAGSQILHGTSLSDRKVIQGGNQP